MAQKSKVQYINYYTAGSAACQYEPEIVRAKPAAALPRPKRQQRIVIRVDPAAVLGACMAVVMLVMMLCGVVRLMGTWQRQAQMNDYVQRLQQENEQLRQTYEQGYDLEEIYEIATAMGMVPVEQLRHVQVQLPEAETVEESSGWESFRTFLSGLFA